MKKTVILLFGGKSAEHEVSILSARSIYNAIDKEKYQIFPMGIDKLGFWLGGNEALPALTGEKLLPEAMDHNQGKVIDLIGSGEAVVFPVLHGRHGEDGTIQGMLEIMNVPYVGSGVLGSALGMDKTKQKELCRLKGIPVVDFLEIRKDSWDAHKNSSIQVVKAYYKSQYPLFIKPVNAGSSVGVTKVHNSSELVRAITAAFCFDKEVLVEKGLENVREIETSVLGNNFPQVSVCGEVIASNEFYDYDAKYFDERSKLIIPADISENVQGQIKDFATRAFKIIECSGLARADFFVEKGTDKVWLNELNTMPGFTQASMYPRLWEASGLSYDKLIERLIELAIERWQQKKKIRYAV